jgi:hypothetical protein
MKALDLVRPARNSSFFISRRVNCDCVFLVREHAEQHQNSSPPASSDDISCSFRFTTLHKVDPESGVFCEADTTFFGNA